METYLPPGTTMLYGVRCELTGLESDSLFLTKGDAWWLAMNADTDARERGDGHVHTIFPVELP